MNIVWMAEHSRIQVLSDHLLPGSYTVTVRDAASITFDVAVTITQPATSVSGSVSSQTNVLCFGATTGTVTVDGSGGTPPYLYKLGSGSYQASGTFAKHWCRYFYSHGSGCKPLFLRHLSYYYTTIICSDT